MIYPPAWEIVRRWVDVIGWWIELEQVRTPSEHREIMRPELLLGNIVLKPGRYFGFDLEAIIPKVDVFSQFP